LKLRNRTGSKIDFIWVDFEGKERTLKVIPPGMGVDCPVHKHYLYRARVSGGGKALKFDGKELILFGSDS